MRTGLTVLVLGCLGLFVACGGNVVVDVPGSGTTGTGGASTSTACSNISGEQLEGGGCQTDALCHSQQVEILCEPNQGGATCSCTVSGTVAGMCEETGVLPNPKLCSPTVGCCAKFFGG